jgi:hypothetical protein
MKPCVRTLVVFRRVGRHPITRRVVRGAQFGVVPGALNDVAFHHATLSMSEIAHAVQDTATISLFVYATKLALRSKKY